MILRYNLGLEDTSIGMAVLMIEILLMVWNWYGFFEVLKFLSITY